MKQDALAFLQAGTEIKDTLAENFAPLIENVMKATLSTKIKNTEGSGIATQGGSMVFTRMVNSESKPYGTARTSQAGENLEFGKVTVYIDTDREIVNEAQNKDLKLYTIDQVLTRKRKSNAMSMVRELEEAFFQTAVDGGTKFEASESANTIGKELEELIVSVETTRNDYVNGVNRDMLELILNTSRYSLARDYIDTTVRNASINVGDELIPLFHGVRIYSNLYLPTGVDEICMVTGSVAQPVIIVDYDANKIPFASAWSIELYYSYGTGCVMPDLIKYTGTYETPSN